MIWAGSGIWDLGDMNKKRACTRVEMSTGNADMCDAVSVIQYLGQYRGPPQWSLQIIMQKYLSMYLSMKKRPLHHNSRHQQPKSSGYRTPKKKRLYTHEFLQTACICWIGFKYCGPPTHSYGDYMEATRLGLPQKPCHRQNQACRHSQTE